MFMFIMLRFQDYTNVLNSYKNPHTGFEKVKMVVVCHVIDKGKNFDLIMVIFDGDINK